MRLGSSRFVGPLIVAILVILAIVVTIMRVGGPGDKATQSPDAQSAPKSTTSIDPAELTKEKATLNQRVKVFSRLYFSLSPARSPQEIKASVAPFASSHFMETAVFGFSSSAADQAMIEEDASLHVTAISKLIGEFQDSKTASGVVLLNITKLDHNGNVVIEFQRQQKMTWVKQSDTWFVYDAPRI